MEFKKKIKGTVLGRNNKVISRIQPTSRGLSSLENNSNHNNQPVPVKPTALRTEKKIVNTLNDKRDVEKTPYKIEEIHRNKEEKLLNLIVKIIVKSTLEQIYGKESN